MASDFILRHPDTAKNFLWKFDNAARLSGEEIFHKGGARRLLCLVPGVAYSAQVVGPKSAAVFEAKVRCDGPTAPQWQAECTCLGLRVSASQLCPHAYALLRTVLVLHGRGGASPDGTPAPVTPAVTTNALPGQLALSRAGASVKPTPERLVMPVLEKRLRDLLIERLGRPLLNPEEAYLTKVSTAFRTTRGKLTVQTYDLTPLGLRPVAHSLGVVQIWPKAPETEHQFWLYLVAFAQQHQLPWPDFMEPVSDLSEAGEEFSRWQHEQQVQRWIGIFQQVSRSVAPSSPQRVDLRLALLDHHAQLEACRLSGSRLGYSPVKSTEMNQLQSEIEQGLTEIEAMALPLWLIMTQISAKGHPTLNYQTPAHAAQLHQFLRASSLASRITGPNGEHLVRASQPLRAVISEGLTPESYRLRLVQDDGSPVPPIRLVISGQPPLFITRETIFSGPLLPLSPHELTKPIDLPAEAVETLEGVVFLERIKSTPPHRLAEKIRRVPWKPQITAQLRQVQSARGAVEACVLDVTAETADKAFRNHYGDDGWLRQDVADAQFKPAKGPVIVYDRQPMHEAAQAMDRLGAIWHTGERCWVMKLDRAFAATFSDWVKNMPASVDLKLKGDLTSFAEEAVQAEVALEASPAPGQEKDWFDLRVVLNLSETSFTDDELQALLEARGGYVRLEKKGWRKLEFDLSDADDALLARLGLTPRDFTKEPQRLHALQLADEAAERWLSEEQFTAIRQRAAEIKARVQPAVPSTIQASLRPYQVEGFHFLAYLTENSFGGILADDMGLGKTLQTLTWLEWLRQKTPKPTPALVVCPKSVADNWRAEAKKFLPHLKVRVWAGTDLKRFPKDIALHDLHILNYAQLRSVSDRLPTQPFLTVILDEAQAIKNPSSDTAKSARQLPAMHRVALSGTPIENRLLDLWSIMAFAMPGILGPRGHFTRLFAGKDDPRARQRLGARVRPFLIRRTKSQVAQDLPERIEEDILCEIEGQQQALYKAELKTAQQLLLKVQSAQDLNKERFHVLTTLTRLRQICCDPRLLNPQAEAPSAKVEALIETIEPILAEGQKVLIFSQFTSMLALLEKDLRRHFITATPEAESLDELAESADADGEKVVPRFFMLTGQTEDRGQLVQAFQGTEGPAVFFISLKAGGSGLNLTAASYVVLYDPWWNPAVEAQAIDRTHRIGQTQTVIAYRLLVKDSLEEKIRALQKDKAALAGDVFAEETFSESLSVDDLRYLFE